MTDLIARAPAWVERQLECAVTGVRPIAGSIANENLVIDVGDEGFILKTGRVGDVVAEAWVCGELAERGFAVPEVLSWSRSEPALDGRAVLLTRQFIAQPLTELPSDVHSAPLAEAGRQIARLHELSLPGYGPLSSWFAAEERGQPRGPYCRWRDHLTARLEEADVIAAAGVLPAAVIGRAQRLVRECRIDDVPGRLLHTDLKNQHVFATRQGAFAGIIDWADAAVGDPRYDLARFAMQGEAALDAFCVGYGRRPSATDREVMALYTLQWNLASLTDEVAHGGDWFAVYRGRIEAALDVLA